MRAGWRWYSPPLWVFERHERGASICNLRALALAYGYREAVRAAREADRATGERYAKVGLELVKRELRAQKSNQATARTDTSEAPA